ncbi:MAG TPA: DUF445 family protein [Chitinophagaceae bacterium]|nr:DUF445 family protein [Chitinophagaceae bacterium]HNF71714.1 DUF445 family protein [Chitinophagaceae bacterium]
MMIYILPFIAAFIGWFTNWIAIKMLFHPRLEKNILGMRVQGIFPKRQQQFAVKLGQLVSRELISFDEISKRINHPDTVARAMPLIEEHVNHFIHHKLKEEMPLLSMFINENTMAGIKKGIVQEIETLFPVLLDKMSSGMKEELDIEQLVVKKVSAFSSDKLEEILMAIMSREFRFVELIGAVLGFIIGLLQLFITLSSS